MKHLVYDTDSRFLVNPITREITNKESKKSTLIQYDHNSERFTFELPRLIEGHDMTKCNRVEVHYINVDKKTNQQSIGVYEVTDIGVGDDENTAVCSWLISHNATQYVGSLSFVLRLCCVTDGVVDYAWNTAIYTVTIDDGINGSEFVTTEFSDVLEQWKLELYNAGYINASTMQANIADLAAALEVERQRINAFVALPEGSTTGDAELTDIRIGADGNAYKTAGDAVRTQAKAAKSDLKNLIADVQTLRLHGDFVNGTLSSGKLNTGYKYRVSTDTIISFANRVTISIADGFRIAIHEFADGEFKADWGWRTGTVTVNAEVGFKCMIARATDDTKEVADIVTFTDAVTMKADHVQTKETVFQGLYAIENVKARYLFEAGDINASGKDANTNYHRLRTHGVCYTPEDIVIVANGKYRTYVYTFDDENYTNPVSHGWAMDGSNDYAISAGTYFRLLMAWVDDNSVSYDEIGDIKTSALYSKVDMRTVSRYAKESGLATKDELSASLAARKSNIISVAHQGYSTTTQYFGNCRLSSYKGAYMMGFDCGELDLQFSSDNIPVCCHDETFVDTNDGSTVITIAEHTAEELKTYGYYGETIATFEEVVAECKRLGLGLYIDKVGNINTNARWTTVFAIVKKYSMAKNITWLAHNDKITAWDSGAKIALVVSSLTNSVIEKAVAIANLGHDVFVNVNYANCTVEQIIEYGARLPANVNIGVWTVDDMETYERYKPYVCAITSNKISDTMTNRD